MLSEVLSAAAVHKWWAPQYSFAALALVAEGFFCTGARISSVRKHTERAHSSILICDREQLGRSLIFKRREDA